MYKFLSAVNVAVLQSIRLCEGHWAFVFLKISRLIFEASVKFERLVLAAGANRLAEPDITLSSNLCPIGRGLPLSKFPQPLPDRTYLPFMSLPLELRFAFNVQYSIAVPMVPAVHDQVRRVKVGAVSLRAQVGMVAAV